METRRISIKDALVLLGYKDTRTLYRWCKIQGVLILSDLGMKMKYLSYSQFWYAYNSSHRKKSENKHGLSSEELSYKMKMESEIRLAIHEKKTMAEYKPKNKHEKESLSRLTDALNKTNNLK